MGETTKCSSWVNVWIFVFLFVFYKNLLKLLLWDTLTTSTLELFMFFQVTTCSFVRHEV